MSTRVRIEQQTDGTVVAVKSATIDEAPRLGREADALGRSRHPGLVELLGYSTKPDGEASLTTRFAGSHSLATARLRSLDHVCAVVAAIAATLADLHDLHLTHGHLEAAHVLLDHNGRPVLCSPTGEGSAADDVRQLGELLAALLSAEVEAEPIPERRFRWTPRGSRSHRYQHRALLNLADQATADEASRRPTARWLAAAVHDLVPTAAFEDVAQPVLAPAGGDGAPPPATSIDDGTEPIDFYTLHGLEHLRASVEAEDEPPRRAPRLFAISAAIAGLALCGLGISALFWRPPASDRDRCAGSATPEAGFVDTDADGCADRVVVDKGIVEVGERRWTVGEPGDRVTVGDWDCDGLATAAVLRPSTGEVFVFDAWAGPQADVEASVVAVVDQARTVESVAQGDSCQRLEVIDHNGRRHRIRTPEAGS